VSQLYGWTGKILRVDLSSETMTTIDTADYVPTYVGGLGIAARIAWDELDPGVGHFDPENMLFLMTGPLTGTTASGGGRVVVAGIAPQQRPPVFSRSGIGGHWGAELKYAGYDGIVIVGCASSPRYLWVHDGEVDLIEADDLWGLGTYATTNALRYRHGARTRVLSIGQAGERLSRIACIQTETGNAAGQGGYGAVMGAKNLKAVAVRGTGGVRVTEPEQLLDMCLSASREGQRPPNPGRVTHRRSPLDQEVPYRRKKCGFCMSNCQGWQFMGVPGESSPGLHQAYRSCYGFKTTTTAAQVEAQALTSDLGLNGWEIAFGIIPWLQMCAQHGLIDAVDGLAIPLPEHEIAYNRDVAPCSAEFVSALIRQIAFRQGELGDALAEGACYAAERLFGGQGVSLLDRIYPRHAGQTSHWNAHWGTGGNIYFPFWLVPVL
jgi:aldehyde:ferredoxin oxidoreductase